MRKAVWCAVVLALVAAPAAAQSNMLAVVERVTAADPARFACAHSGRPCEADWIQAVAAELHGIDPAWGLNAKRDGPASDLSLDVVTYRVGPTDRHVRVWDICGACGSASARPVWNEITDKATMGQPGTARWVQPPVGTAPHPTPNPPIPPVPAPPPVDLAPVLAAIEALGARLNALIALYDSHQGDWTKAAHEAGEAAARASEIKTAIEALPVAQPQKCVSGSQSGWAGGKIRLCPEPQ